MKSSKFKAQSSKILLSIIFYFLTSFILMGISDLAAAGITTITILERAEIEDDMITLGEIAEIKGDDTTLMKKLRAIEVGKAPLPGKSRRIDEGYVMIRLKQNGIDVSQIKLDSPKNKEIEVIRSFIKIPREKIEKVVLDFIYEKIPGDRDEVKVKNIRISHDVILPKGNVSYKVVPPPNMDLSGIIAIPVFFKVNGELKKKIWATANVEIFKEVIVTKRPLGRYQPITEGDIELQKVNVANLPSNIIPKGEEIIGKRTRRKISSNVVLRTDLIELPPLVKRGDVVTIIVESDALRITTMGEVKKRGHRGEKIRVVSFESKKEIYARILDSNTVMVDF